MKIKKKLILSPGKNDWEFKGVFNPAAIMVRKEIHLFYRAVGNEGISRIGHAIIKKGKIKRFSRPILFPEKNYELKGMEDPRITKLGGEYYLLYTAFDGKTARVAYAVSRNLKNWRKKGVISPNIEIGEAIKLVKVKRYKKAFEVQKKSYPRSFLWDKDAILFPEKIHGKYAMLHRLNPDIQIVFFNKFSDLKKRSFWKKYIENIEEKIIMKSEFKWDSARLGGGATPIKIKDRWLLIYHGARKLNKVSSIKEKTGHVYNGGVAMFSPDKGVKRLSKALLKPDEIWERRGNVNDVVFPEGAIVDGEKLKIFFGGADKTVGVAELDLDDLISKFDSKV